ncbi:MAG: response regulator [Desulfomonile tiedjei]|nr:response regulator [Desulfomonile tiedjei]
MSSPEEILIVEDSSMQAKRLKRLLEQNGYQVRVAYNGREGLEAAIECKPSLVVSDIMMPVMDGYEMCRLMKNDPRLKHIPIILLTSLSNPQDVFSGLESGADSYVCKPYDGRVLLARIRHGLTFSHSEQSESDGQDLEVFVGDKRYVISSNRRQILNLLLSTYEDAVEQNRILREMRTKLVMVNETLEKLVSERTEALQKEILERQRIEESLASEKERLSVTLRSIADGVITTNTEGQIILMNPAAENLTGWPQEEAMGKSLTTVFNLIKTKTRDGGQIVVENILKTGGVFGFDDQTSLIPRGGVERIVAVSGTPLFDPMNRIIGVVLVFRDITDSKRMEEELVKAQKLESLGVLAGGIAHDFNNLLTAILGNISLAKVHCQREEKVLQRLGEAEKASLRAKDLTHQLLTFSKGGAPVKRTSSIPDLLRESVWFALSGSNVRCDLSIPGDLWAVEVDEGQISQVIHNLIINADQAMPHGGVIKVYAENTTIDPEHPLAAPLTAQRYVRLSVEDEGVGIPQENISKVFDPYFTTKQKGSGLGLASCYSILKNHSGFITVDSEVGKGSTFHVYLPAAATKKAAPRHIQDGPINGKGLVLVMDDEEVLRNFVAELLNYLGYDVQLASNGLETLDLYIKAKKAGRPVDCVLMDLTIPGAMGGKEAIQKLLEIDPDVTAIVSSGYSDDPVMADYERYGFRGVVAKPYDATQLSEVLHKVIKNRDESLPPPN